MNSTSGSPACLMRCWPIGLPDYRPIASSSATAPSGNVSEAAARLSSKRAIAEVPGGQQDMWRSLEQPCQHDLHRRSGQPCRHVESFADSSGLNPPSERHTGEDLRRQRVDGGIVVAVSEVLLDLNADNFGDVARFVQLRRGEARRLRL